MTDENIKFKKIEIMKKVKFNGKLSLNKETIAKLNNEQMNAVNGGKTVITLEQYTCVGCNTINTCAASVCRFEGSVCKCIN